VFSVDICPKLLDMIQGYATPVQVRAGLLPQCIVLDPYLSLPGSVAVPLHFVMDSDSHLGLKYPDTAQDPAIFVSDTQDGN
jgi:hypothetical protein